MLRFAMGIMVGLFLGSVAGAYAAIVAGGNGYLIGWSVSKEGEEICSDPYVWQATKVIECD